MRLEADEVHVWRAKLTQPPEYVASFGDTLSADEHERAARIRFDPHRRRFLASRGIQRDVLSRYTGIPAGELAFEYSESGKPALAGLAKEWGLSFNVSNSGDLAVYAVAHAREVGVDIEHVRPVRNAHLIALRFFSTDELRFLGLAASTQAPDAFLHCWARREACVKLFGGTVWTRRDAFEDFAGAARAGRTRPAAPEGKPCQLYALELGQDYVGALAVDRTTPVRLRYFDWVDPVS